MVKILLTGSDSRFGKIFRKIKSKNKFIFRNKKELNILSAKGMSCLYIGLFLDVYNFI